MTDEEQKQLAIEVASLIQSSFAPPMLSVEEHEWVRLAIRRESQSIALRNAVITKTLGGLVWAGLGFLAFLFVSWLRSIGVKV